MGYAPTAVLAVHSHSLITPSTGGNGGASPESVYPEGPPCWRCQAAPTPPPIDAQLAILRRVHAMKDEIFHWPEADWERLRGLLREGDVLALVLGSVYVVRDLSYEGVHLRRDSKDLFIDHRAFFES